MIITGGLSTQGEINSNNELSCYCWCDAALLCSALVALVVVLSVVSSLRHTSSCINAKFQVSSSVNICQTNLILSANVFKMISFEVLPLMIFPESLI